MFWDENFGCMKVRIYLGSQSLVWRIDWWLLDRNSDEEIPKNYEDMITWSDRMDTKFSYGPLLPRNWEIVFNDVDK